MGSYGMLAKRVLETEMPVMVQVFRPKSKLGKFLFFFLFLFFIFVASICMVLIFFFLLMKFFGAVLFQNICFGDYGWFFFFFLRFKN